MRVSSTITAATLRAILCYIDPNNTPKTAFDDDSLAEPLRNKIKEAVGDSDGSQSVTIFWGDHEENLFRQFTGICRKIKEVFEDLDNYFTRLTK